MPDPKDYINRPMSRHQYGTLKFIAENKVTMAYLRHAHGTTLGSIAQRGFIARVGSSEGAAVILAKAGEEALRLYQHATLNERSHEGELTERCLRLLKHARGKVVSLPHAS